MFYRNRRANPRFVLGYHVLIQKGIMISEEMHMARILDASSSGMRLFLAGVPPLPVGGELSLQCIPARARKYGNDWQPVQISCRVVWRDIKNYSYGMLFL